MHRFATGLQALTICLLSTCLWSLTAEAAHSATWSDALQQEVEKIDRESPGKLGVYVKRMNGGETFSHGGDQLWYLGSTVKVAVGIAVYQKIDAGQLKLSDRLTLQDIDRIEAGPLAWEKTGATFTVESLLKRMLQDSDNTASNMLIRNVGLDRLNDSAKAAMGGKDFHRITTLAQVRYDVYAEIHPSARQLSNLQMVQIAGAPMGPQRVEALRRALRLETADLKAKTIEEAYARYYDTHVNSATLQAYGNLLEALTQGKLLSANSTRLMF